jgi:hypothetical protein
MAGGGHWRRGRADRRPRRRPRADALAPSRRSSCCVAASLPSSLAPSRLAPLAPSRSRWCKPRAGQRGCWSGQSDRGGADEGGPRLGDAALTRPSPRPAWVALSQSQRRKMLTHCVASGHCTASLVTLTAVWSMFRPQITAAADFSHQ